MDTTLSASDANLATIVARIAKQFTGAPIAVPVVFSGPLAGCQLVRFGSGAVTLSRDGNPIAELPASTAYTNDAALVDYVCETLAPDLLARDGADLRKRLGVTRRQAARLRQFCHVASDSPTT